VRKSAHMRFSRVCISTHAWLKTQGAGPKTQGVGGRVVGQPPSYLVEMFEAITTRGMVGSAKRHDAA
jgi:hypothetical protein